jgi:hypothetical protein
MRKTHESGRRHRIFPEAALYATEVIEAADMTLPESVTLAAFHVAPASAE